MSQPKALFLADVIKADPASKTHHDEAAAELRRLHDVEKAYKSACDIISEQDKKLAELEAVNQELLGALKAVCTHAPRSSQQIEADWNKARALIAKAEGEQK